MTEDLMQQSTENYLRDVIQLLMEKAREAKARRDAFRTSGDRGQATFEQGRALAYYEVISTMLNELESFGIPRHAVGVPAAFDPDRELL
jgi:hypothetical protein